MLPQSLTHIESQSFVIQAAIYRILMTSPTGSAGSAETIAIQFWSVVSISKKKKSVEIIIPHSMEKYEPAGIIIPRIPTVSDLEKIMLPPTSQTTIMLLLMGFDFACRPVAQIGTSYVSSARWIVGVVGQTLHRQTQGF